MDEEDPRALEESSNSETEDYLEVDDYLEVMLKMKFPTMKILISFLDLHDNVREPEISLTLSEEGSGNNSGVLALPLTDPYRCLNIFLTNHIQDDIVKWTNAEITIKRQNYKQDTSTQNDTSKDFMNKLHMQLIESWLKMRPEIRTMPYDS